MVVALQAAISRFVAEANDDPKPFAWLADPNKSIIAVRRGYQVLDLIQKLPEGISALQCSRCTNVIDSCGV
jgi:hypothetical protein